MLEENRPYGKISASIALGNRLHLFEALAKVGSEQEPASAAQVAEECGCKERYVKEWLAVMGTADIITVTEEEKFYIKEEHFYDIMAKYSEAAHKKHLIPDYLPALGSDVKERLEAGGMTCLDVGCGKGFHAALLENGEQFDNLSFIQMDASKMDADWTCKFDLVTIFDACHDQMRPDLCLKEIYRILKNEGMFAMLEVDGTSNIYKDKEQMGLSAASGYADSLFNCLPIGSNSEDALGLGAMWGRERAMKMLNEVGFADVSIVPAPFFRHQVLYVCKKC
ncbi:unnamed protein product [Cylicostephanus goldi]|uniref:Uncharacterized protein n=1 Tax=Cylicostephanus goldi TaxID=71465 RepID=A0A3P7MSZ3_CYLGO|nr:unnamed protein product [Cylicostephanus goldi]